VSLSIGGANLPPVALDDAATGDEDTVLSGNVLGNDTDVDGDGLTVNLVSGPSHGTLDLAADGSFSYTPQTDYHGSDSFSYLASDGQADSNVATVLLTINPVNDRPTVDPISPQDVVEGQTVNLDVVGHDVDADALSYSLIAGPGVIDPQTGAYAWTADDGDTVQQVGVRVTDGQLDSFFDVYFDLNVTNVAPTLTIAGSASAIEDRLYTLNLGASDPGADTIASWGIDWGDGTPWEQFNGNPTQVTHRYADPGSYVIVAAATDEDGIWTANTQPVSVAVNPLQLLSLTPETSGFALHFDRALAAAELNLYDAVADGRDPADLVVTGPGGVALAGSLLVDAAGSTARFVAAGGALAAGDYSVRLRSSADAFMDQAGTLLDGNGDGSGGDDAVRGFTIDAFTGATVGIGDFARGPGQDIDLPAPSGALPITLSSVGGVTSVRFDLSYDPDLLTITGASLAAGVPAGTTLDFGGVAGERQILVTSPTPLAVGTVKLITLDASVPSTAPYTAMQLLDITAVSVNGGALVSRGDDAVQVVAYVGDVNADARYTLDDVTLITNVAVARDSGFGAFARVDPRILADLYADGRITSLDGLMLTREVYYLTTGAANYNVATIPEIPTGFTVVRAAAGLADGGSGASAVTGASLTQGPEAVSDASWQRDLRARTGALIAWLTGQSAPVAPAAPAPSAVTPAAPTPLPVSLAAEVGWTAGPTAKVQAQAREIAARAAAPAQAATPAQPPADLAPVTGPAAERSALQLRLERLKGQAQPVQEAIAVPDDWLTQVLAGIGNPAADAPPDWRALLVTDYAQLDPAPDPNAGIRLELPPVQAVAS